MSISGKVSGLNQIEKNLDDLEKRIGAAVQKGLHLGGLHLQAVSQKQAPAEYGDLRNSAYTEVKGTGLQTRVEVGYTAPYAGFVHEKVDMVLKGQPRPSGLGTYWSPRGAKAKFLEDPARDEMPTIQRIITKEVRKAVEKKNPTTTASKTPDGTITSDVKAQIAREVKKALER